MEKNNALAIFESKKIRRTWFNEEWWFAIEDVIIALTDSADPKQYIKKLRTRDDELAEGWVQIVRPLKINPLKAQQNIQ